MESSYYYFAIPTKQYNKLVINYIRGTYLANVNRLIHSNLIPDMTLSWLQNAYGTILSWFQIRDKNGNDDSCWELRAVDMPEEVQMENSEWHILAASNCLNSASFLRINPPLLGGRELFFWKLGLKTLFDCQNIY